MYEAGQRIAFASPSRTNLLSSGGIAYHSQAQTITVMPSNGHHLTWEDILPNLTLDDNIHFCPTRVISLENTLAGTIFPQAEILRISEEAHKLGITMHLE